MAHLATLSRTDVGLHLAVSVDDMKRLRSGEFLNDTLVDVQQLELQSRLSQSVQARCVANLHRSCAVCGRRLQQRARHSPPRRTSVEYRIGGRNLI